MRLYSNGSRFKWCCFVAIFVSTFLTSDCACAGRLPRNVHQPQLKITTSQITHCQSEFGENLIGCGYPVTNNRILDTVVNVLTLPVLVGLSTSAAITQCKVLTQICASKLNNGFDTASSFVGGLAVCCLWLVGQSRLATSIFTTPLHSGRRSAEQFIGDITRQISRLIAVTVLLSSGLSLGMCLFEQVQRTF